MASVFVFAVMQILPYDPPRCPGRATGSPSPRRGHYARRSKESRKLRKLRAFFVKQMTVSANKM
jgi:hypothetical protein